MWIKDFSIVLQSYCSINYEFCEVHISELFQMFFNSVLLEILLYLFLSTTVKVMIMLHV